MSVQTTFLTLHISLTMLFNSLLLQDQHLIFLSTTKIRENKVTNFLIFKTVKNIRQMKWTKNLLHINHVVI